MVYTLLPATPADLSDIIAIYHAAFATDPFIGQLMPNVPPEVRQNHDMHWYGREFELSELNGLRFRKVVDENGCSRSLSRLHLLQFLGSCTQLTSCRKLLAFAKWQYPYTLTAEERMRKAQLDRVEELEFPYPEGANRDLYDVFFAALREKKAIYMDESKDYCKS